MKSPRIGAKPNAEILGKKVYIVEDRTVPTDCIVITISPQLSGQDQQEIVDVIKKELQEKVRKQLDQLYPGVEFVAHKK